MSNIDRYLRDSNISNYAKLSAELESKGFQDVEDLISKIDSIRPIDSEMCDILTLLESIDSLDTNVAKELIASEFEFDKAALSKPEVLMNYFKSSMHHLIDVSDKNALESIEPKLQEYYRLLAGIYKRLYDSSDIIHTKDLNMAQVVSSVINAILMKEVLKDTVSERLLLALDFSSLIRLSLVAGGQTIQIPTYEELIHLLAGVKYYYLIEFNNVPEEKAFKYIKDTMNVSLDKWTMNRIHKYLVSCFASEGTSQSMDVYFNKLMDFLEESQEKLKYAIDNVDSPQDLVNMYTQINDSILDLASGLKR